MASQLLIVWTYTEQRKHKIAFQITRQCVYYARMTLISTQ